MRRTTSSDRKFNSWFSEERIEIQCSMCLIGYALNPTLPVIIGPANEQECVTALNRGADDYVTEPVSLRELLARIRVILRYERSTWSQARQPEALRYVFAGWTYDHLTQRLTKRHSARIALSQMDCALLKAFLDAPQRVLSREHLVRATRTGKDICDRSVNVRIVRLRRKLSAGGASQDIIRAQRGFGYVFTVPVVRQPTGIAEIPLDHVGQQKRWLHALVWLPVSRRSEQNLPGRPTQITSATNCSRAEMPK
jgi:DNA-binding response OmpR family regulator